MPSDKQNKSGFFNYLFLNRWYLKSLCMGQWNTKWNSSSRSQKTQTQLFRNVLWPVLNWAHGDLCLLCKLSCIHGSVWQFPLRKSLWIFKSCCLTIFVLCVSTHVENNVFTQSTGVYGWVKWGQTQIGPGRGLSKREGSLFLSQSVSHFSLLLPPLPLFLLSPFSSLFSPTCVLSSPPPLCSLSNSFKHFVSLYLPLHRALIFLPSSTVNRWRVKRGN